MDAKTNVRLSQCQELLWAMRRDMSTTNVAIFIKDIRAANHDEYSRHEVISERRCHADHVKDIKPLRVRGGSGPNRASGINGNRNNVKGKNGGSGRVCSAPGAQGTVFRAHKCILEATAFFSRMLNGNFRESQADENGVFKIELSSDMFDVEIMDILLDYLYTREPVVDKIESNVHEDHHPPNPPQESRLRHVTSANVGLNLETVITETRKKSLSADSLRLRQRRSHHQRPLSTSELTLSHWGALYRAATHLEDKELQTLSLQQIQANLDPETTLEQVLSWGHQHEEVKSVMLEYLIKKRREIFGDDHHNKLRPYLWAEYDQQVETLVEITSQIARQ
ncbi:hypothetical protein BGX21_007997 [Mortierella sp. AD011]|nr:hypothetical protein BGX21_007997 [Mortierella sp. AD011]